MDEEVCDGVKILCERMENNPEDFGEGPINPHSFDRSLGKYYYEGRTIEGLARGSPEALESYWHLNQAERDALVASYKTMMRNEFTRRVVEKLLEQPEPEVDVAKAIRKANSPVTVQQIQNESLALLNRSFEEAYDHTTDTMKYKALGRYKLGM